LSLASKQRGELKASLISSKNLTSEELENLSKDLSKTMGAAIALDYVVDENLIGGLKVQIGSLMIDTSIKNKLKKYEQTMLEI
jgi:F-type H+-transporting ATPase subunit delta